MLCGHHKKKLCTCRGDRDRDRDRVSATPRVGRNRAVGVAEGQRYTRCGLTTRARKIR